MKTIVIVPAYNEQDNIIDTITDLKENASFADYVIINDCSTDSTLKTCIENEYSYISIPVNMGIGTGVQTGYKYADENGYDIAVQFDGDGQHDASYIGRLIQPIIENTADFVIGSRYIEKIGFQSSKTRQIGIQIFKILILILSGKHITDATSGFRAANKKALAFLVSNYATDYPEPESVMALLRENFRVVEIPVRMKERKHGTSSINTLKSFYYMIKVSLAVIIAALRPKQR